jgi:hypothetical protein
VWNSLVFFAGFGTVRSIVTGNPTPDPAKTYLVAADLTAGALHVYSIANAEQHGRQDFRALNDAAYALSAPTRR